MAFGLRTLYPCKSIPTSCFLLRAVTVWRRTVCVFSTPLSVFFSDADAIILSHSLGCPHLHSTICNQNLTTFFKKALCNKMKQKYSLNTQILISINTKNLKAVFFLVCFLVCFFAMADFLQTNTKKGIHL